MDLSFLHSTFEYKLLAVFFYIAIIAAFIGMCVFFLKYEYYKRRPNSFLFEQIKAKCGATSMAVLVALVGCMINGIPSHWVMLAGLIVCTVADGVICVHLLPGGALFALGHILYMIAFVMMNKPGWPSAVLFLLLSLSAAAGIAHFRSRIGDQYKLFIVYAILLSAMVALSVPQAPLYLAGALLFAISDGLLGFVAMNRRNRPLDYISLGTYYLGQFLLGLAVLLN